MTADIVRELTPYTLTADEGAAVRAGFDLALRVRYEEAHIAVCDLSEDALRDALLAQTLPEDQRAAFWEKAVEEYLSRELAALESEKP